MKKTLFLLLAAISMALPVSADTCMESNITISQIQPVSGKYPSEKHKNTIELHHEARAWCGIAECSPNTWRVAIEGDDAHIVSAAYMAFAADKKVNILIDTGLGTKNGICVVSYLQVKK